MKTRRLTIGHRSEFTSEKFAGTPHAVSIEGFYCCTLCAKLLNATEVAVRSHLRKHIRRGELKQEDYFATVQTVCHRG